MSHSMPSDLLFDGSPNPVALLTEAHQRFNKRELAQRIDVDRKTLTRWEKSPERLPIARQLAL